MKRFYHLSLAWLCWTAVIIYKTHAMMPRSIAFVGITITLALFYYFEWFRWFLAFWYTGSFVVFHLSERYRELYVVTIEAYQLTE